MESATAADRHFMLRAFELAARGLYTTHPNPRVGCVLVRDGAVVGEGWHARAGGDHAEIVALARAGERARGATAYVTLEPCAHAGRTGPCTEALVDAGVGRVVAARTDPNPHVTGGGLERLRAAGIDTDVGLLAERNDTLNAGFLSRMERGRPYVRLKSAMSLDGRTALADGRSFWITGEAARADVHRVRARSDAIVTGRGTVLRDNPRLTARLDGVDVRPALCVVLDRYWRCPPTAAVLAHPGGCLIAGHAPGDAQAAARAAALDAAGAGRLELPEGGDGVMLSALLAALAARQINEVLVEAGARVAGAWLRAGRVDEWLVYVAPHLLGPDALALAELPRLAAMDERLSFTRTACEVLGADVKLVLRPARGTRKD